MNKKIYDAINAALVMAGYYAIGYREENTWADGVYNQDQIEINFKIVNDAREALDELVKQS